MGDVVGQDNYLSTAKAIGIILMVVGHTIDPNFVCRFIYMFHMPLFFFCSGYFYKTPNSLQEVGRFTLRRIRRLYFPYVKWGVFFLLLHNQFCSWHIYNPSIYGYYDYDDYLHRLKSLLFTMTGHEQLLDPFWFLKELFLASILICLLTFVFKKVESKFKDVAIWILLIVMAVITKPCELGLPVIWNLSLMFLSAFFVFSGYLYSKIEKTDYYSVLGGVLSFAFLCCAVLVWNDSLDMLWYNAESVLFFIPSAFIGIFMTFTIAYLLEPYSIKKIFYYLGKNTMIILVLHLLVFKFVSFLKIYVFGLSMERLSEKGTIIDNNEIFWFVYFLMGILIPLLYSELSRLIKKKMFNFL